MSPNIFCVDLLEGFLFISKEALGLTKVKVVHIVHNIKVNQGIILMKITVWFRIKCCQIGIGKLWILRSERRGWSHRRTRSDWSGWSFTSWSTCPSSLLWLSRRLWRTFRSTYRSLDSQSIKTTTGENDEIHKRQESGQSWPESWEGPMLQLQDAKSDDIDIRKID